MLRHRLWMGAVLIGLVVGVLLVDAQLAPVFPFLFALVLILALLGCYELLALLGPGRRPWPWLSYLAVLLLICANWPAQLWPWARELAPDPFTWVLVVFTLVLLAGFLAAMRSFQPHDEGRREENVDTISKLSLLVFLAAYLGVLPSFLAQLRWPPTVRAGDANLQAVLGLTLAIFTPKFCDIGAYTVGRLFGKHRMTPVLSPKKTWEGLAGGLAFSVIFAVVVNRLGPVLPGNDLIAAAFGLTIGLAGVLGDLAESLIKRECRQKDASHVMPGFGGVLDVIDSIIFSAPISYLWLR